MKYYCIGIKGSGMATLACLLNDLGETVSGYDDVKEEKFTEKGLKARGIPIFYDSTHPLDKDTIVTYSKAFKEDHKEMVRVRQLGLTIKEYNEVVGDLTKRFQTISVCGTHGKTTTTSMISEIIDKAYGCNYFIGDGRGKLDKKNQYFVIESDEFNRHFLKYSPSIAVVTNIELEHMECYQDIDDIISTFQTFIEKCKDTVFLCGDNENVRKLKPTTKAIYYGFSEENDAVIKNLKRLTDGVQFDLWIDETYFSTFQLPLFGNHMVLDAVACILVCHHLNIPKEQIFEELQKFHNAERRFQEEICGSTVIIDDYAHHPTEIRATLEAARQKYPDKKIIAIFKPNTYSRTKDFYSDFADSLNLADFCFLTEIDANREKQEEYPGVTSKMIFDLLENKEMLDVHHMESVTRFLGEVICFMSCASVAHMKEDLISHLSVKQTDK